MKNFWPRAEDTPPDEDPGGLSGPKTVPHDHPESNKSETTPMPRSHRQSRNAGGDFRGERRYNTTQASTSDPDVAHCKRSPGIGAMLCSIGRALVEIRSRLVVPGDLRRADGRPERSHRHDRPHSPSPIRRFTVEADKGCDTADGVPELRLACRTPDVAQMLRHSAIDGRTTWHEGDVLAIKHRKRIDLRRENDPRDRFLILLCFGRARTVGGMAETVYCGIQRMQSRFILTMAADTIAGLPRLLTL